MLLRFAKIPNNWKTKFSSSNLVRRRRNAAVDQFKHCQGSPIHVRSKDCIVLMNKKELCSMYNMHILDTMWSWSRFLDPLPPPFLQIQRVAWLLVIYFGGHGNYLIKLTRNYTDQLSPLILPIIPLKFQYIAAAESDYNNASHAYSYSNFWLKFEIRNWIIFFLNWL